MSSQFLFRSPLEQKIEDRPLLLWFGRLYRPCCRSLGWLVNLELFFQLLNKCRDFLLSFRVDLLPQCSFHFSAFLDIARFKLCAFLWAQVEARIPNCRLSLAPDSLASQILSFAHDVLLCRTHSQPALGVAPEVLLGFRGHCEPPLTCALLGRGGPVRRPCGRPANWPM
jgi:hypothetical protein